MTTDEPRLERRVVRLLVRWSIHPILLVVATLATLQLAQAFASRKMPDLQSWHQVEALLRLAQPIVIYRSGDPASLAAAACAELSETARARLERGFVAAPPVDASSSELRRRLAAGEEPGDALPPHLREYIARKGIYRAA